MKDIEVVATAIRRATLIVKLSPFVYTAVYIAAIIAYMFDCEVLSDILDRCFVVSPFVSLVFVLLSYALRMCNWHRLQCVLPIFPAVVAVIDDYCVELSAVAVAVNFGLIITLSIATLINVYYVFRK
jgi:hypothetical protein